MLERQIKHSQDLNPHTCGHLPRMYRARGDRRTVFYLECARCLVHTHRFQSPAAAARAWNAGGMVEMTMPAENTALGRDNRPADNITPFRHHRKAS